MLTRDPYILPDTAQIGEIFYNRLVTKSSTIATLVRKFMVILHAFITLGPTAKEKMKEGAHLMTKELLQREAWRAILFNSQRYYPFKILAKNNIFNIQGVLYKLTTNDPLAISLLGTDVTPIVSNKDPLLKLLINKAHLRQIHSSVKPIHSTASTTLA